VLRLDAMRGVLLSSLQGTTVAEFRRLREIRGHEMTPEWVLHHLMQHEAEHRGQIAELRAAAERALGIDRYAQFG
jgi:uncharacterized damage-inducible protein DinB